MAILDTIKNQILVQSEDGSANKQEKIPLIRPLVSAIMNTGETSGRLRGNSFFKELFDRRGSFVARSFLF